MRITFPLALAMAASITACSATQPESTQAPSPPPPAVPQAVAPPVVQAPQVTQPKGVWTDWQIAPGQWVYRQDARGSLALFGQSDRDATVIIRCDENRSQIFISRAGAVTTETRMTLRASSGLQGYQARSNGDNPSYAAISLDPDDMMLDRIAFSRGRFAIETTGLQSIAVPIWAEFTRVVEDCRA
ncbi:hypothetical protein [Parasphingorhabdus sp.]|uniref:hypothetical protein n=1 Tax=Parasphingorhabdus sp. TaxID=2709688 RepID=UPI003D29416C